MCPTSPVLLYRVKVDEYKNYITIKQIEPKSKIWKSNLNLDKKKTVKVNFFRFLV